MTTTNDTMKSWFPEQEAGAVVNTTETGATALPSPVGVVTPAHAAQDPVAPTHHTDSVELDTGSDASNEGAGADRIGAEVTSNGSDEPTGAVKGWGTRGKTAGAVKGRGVRKSGSTGSIRSTKSQVAHTGSGKSHAVTTKLDAELLRKLTAVRARSGMSESGLLRLALASYLDNLEQRSIAAEISKAAAAFTAAIAAAGQASMAPVVERLNTLEHRVQQQLGAMVAAINGLREALGEPVDLDGLDELSGAGESQGEKS